MTAFALPGARVAPLLSYLKALGAFRVVAEQHDPSARVYWRDGHAVIDGDADLGETLVGFFVDRYRPTPILSPWNSRGGFRRDRMQSSEKLVLELENSTSARLELCRAALCRAREVWERASEMGLVEGEVVPTKRKADFLELCRAWFPDDAVRWLDAVAVLTDDGAVYPALLGGTGGNLGSGDLSSNYIEQVLMITGSRAGRAGLSEERRAALLVASLLREGTPKLGEALVGQFDPGGAGGVNMPGRGMIVNPWDLVLGLEGALLFAAGTSRRLSAADGPSGASTAAMPFTVRPSQGTVRSQAEGESTRAEMWLPEWDRPMSLRQLEHLLAEARAQWGRGQARDGVDFVRAVATLGVDRSITSFNRYLVAERLGQSNLAVPAGRVAVHENRSVDLLRDPDIERWLNWLRRLPGTAPRSVVTARNRVNATIFRAAQARPDDSRPLQDFLVELASAEQVAGRMPDARSRMRPMLLRDGEGWFQHLDDGSAEFDIALALASQRDPLPKGELDVASRRMSRFALMVRPVELDPRTRRLRWAEGTLAPGLAQVPLATVLRHVIERRATRGDRLADDGNAVVQMRGVDVAFRWACRASLENVRLLSERALDLDRIAGLTAGLCLIDWRSTKGRSRSTPQHGAYDPRLALLAPFFHADPVRIPTADPTEPDRRVRFSPTMPLVSAVVRSRLRRASELAARRLAQYGVDVSVRTSHLPDDASRGDVLLALSVPLATPSVEQLLRQVDHRERVRQPIELDEEVPG